MEEIDPFLAPDGLPTVHENPFLDCLCACFVQHRPLALASDHIWLVLVQGFAAHVAENAEELRHHFVDFEGKKNLVKLTHPATLDFLANEFGTRD